MSKQDGWPKVYGHSHIHSKNKAKCNQGATHARRTHAHEKETHTSRTHTCRNLTGIQNIQLKTELCSHSQAVHCHFMITT